MMDDNNVSNIERIEHVPHRFTTNKTAVTTTENNSHEYLEHTQDTDYTKQPYRDPVHDAKM